MPNASSDVAPDELAAATNVRPAPVEASPPPLQRPATPVEFDGPAGPEPTRYGDWERKGRCIDF